jgi:hypothetical protein
VKWSILVLNTLFDKKDFLVKRFLNFGKQSFGDVKYLYFLCSEMHFFYVRFGACFGFVTLRATLAHVTCPHEWSEKVSRQTKM